MKTKDIIVGQRYSHVNYPGTVYIGTGEEVANGVFTKKALFISQDNGGSDNCSYHLVKALSMNSRYSREFWKGFRKIVN